MVRNCHIIVGAGEAGVAAAFAMRSNGFAGRICLIGEEVALPYARPPLSKEMLGGRPTPKAIRAGDSYKANGIDLMLGCRVVEIDGVRRTVRARDSSGAVNLVEYDKLLFTTGSTARACETLDQQGGDVLYLRTIEDAALLRGALARARSVIIIGGGVVGLEVAASARMRGLEVIVVEATPRLMGRSLSPEGSELLRQLHEQHGVRIMVEVEAIAASRSRGKIVLTLTDGRTLEGDAVIAGIGAAPNTALAQTAGCQINNGVVVDGSGKSTVEGIYAAGDCASLWHPFYGRHLRLEAWQHAREHGAHVGLCMAGATSNYAKIPWFWTDQFDVNLQVGGFPAEASECVHRRCGSNKHTLLHLQGEQLVGVTCFNNGREMRPALNLIASRQTVDRTRLLEPQALLSHAREAA